MERGSRRGEAAHSVMDGWWAVSSVDHLRPEHMAEIQAVLQEAHERGDQVVAHDGLTLPWRPAPVADSLDAAWAEAEAALPEGWHICAVERHCHAGDEVPGQWMAEAHDRDRWESELEYGDTPAAALRALAQKLREAR